MTAKPVPREPESTVTPSDDWPFEAGRAAVRADPPPPIDEEQASRIRRVAGPSAGTGRDEIRAAGEKAARDALAASPGRSPAPLERAVRLLDEGLAEAAGKKGADAA